MNADFKKAFLHFTERQDYTGLPNHGHAITLSREEETIPQVTHNILATFLHCWAKIKMLCVNWEKLTERYCTQ
jgi:hypothetical protein